MTARATNIDSEKLVRSAYRQDANDRFFASAYNKLTRNIARPGGRRKWIYDQAAIGAYKPWRSLTEPMQLAMEAGASEDDVLAIVHCLYGIVHAFYAGKECDALTVKEALRLSVGEGTSEIAADVNAIADPSDSNLEKVLEAKVADRRQDEAAITLIETQLAARARR